MFPPIEAEPQQQPPEEPLPRAAMRPGEFIGHRIWEVHSNIVETVSGEFPFQCTLTQEKVWLQSFVMSCPWWPGVPMCDTTYHPNYHIQERNTIGIWGFKERERLDHYLAGWHYLQHPIIIGTAWLWGTVIEHELGYRAQYASIRSLDEVYHFGSNPEFDLETMRNLYVRKRT